ncbi:hypothetical protein BJ878DRAFT_281084 [Calycina marina]|uniref:Uncharacterized protein n=1 Tax=Calycina marina TaxID=1763456 RepID=A0A9P7YVR0_9HELO|nr:hypothetical protein BJ878DRAFT_281084 [Calycina marina]
MKLSQLVLGLALLPFISATACTSSTAYVWPTSSDISDGSDGSDGSDSGNTVGAGDGSRGSDCDSSCSGDTACITNCLALEQEGQCNALAIIDGGDCVDSSSDLSDPSDLIRRAISQSNPLHRRALDCSAEQTCYAYTDGTLMCIDWNSGDFVMEDGQVGNFLTGDDDTSSSSDSSPGLSGQSSTVRTPTSTAASSSPTNIVDSQTTSASESAAGVGQAGGSVTTSETVGSQSVAVATPTGGAQIVRAGAAMGALGLAVGMVL